MSTFMEIIKDHLQYRHQIFKLAIADLKKTYRGAALGWMWAIIKPAVTIFVYWFTFEMANSRRNALVLYEQYDHEWN